MPRKNMTEEEKKAWGEKMQAARAAKKQEPEVKEEATVSQEDFKELLAHVKELETRLKQPGLEQPHFSSRGSMVGTFEKHTVNPDHYPDPTPRLAKEARLAPLAFEYNYELTYEVSTTNYETRDGVATKEPRFNVNLVKIVLDDSTGEQTNGRYIVRKLMFHEDPQAAITVANDNGVDIESFGEREFLEEMRYYRVRDWLFNIFWPLPVNSSQKTSQRVFGNQLVDFYEASSVDPMSIGLDKLQ